MREKHLLNPEPIYNKKNLCKVGLEGTYEYMNAIKAKYDKPPANIIPNG